MSTVEIGKGDGIKEIKARCIARGVDSRIYQTIIATYWQDLLSGTRVILKVDDNTADFILYKYMDSPDAGRIPVIPVEVMLSPRLIEELFLGNETFLSTCGLKVVEKGFESHVIYPQEFNRDFTSYTAGLSSRLTRYKNQWAQVMTAKLDSLATANTFLEAYLELSGPYTEYWKARGDDSSSYLHSDLVAAELRTDAILGWDTTTDEVVFLNWGYADREISNFYWVNTYRNPGYTGAKATGNLAMLTMLENVFTYEWGVNEIDLGISVFEYKDLWTPHRKNVKGIRNISGSI